MTNSVINFSNKFDNQYLQLTIPLYDYSNLK